MDNEIRYASPESQYEGTGAVPLDTAEMFWLRMEDDYAGRVKLGGLLVRQYRYREAVDVYRAAERIRQDDPMLYLRLGGALLTLFRFGEARTCCEQAAALGMETRKTAFYFGAWDYLTGRYGAAEKRFRQIIPADDENTVSAVYWHTLAAAKAGDRPDLLAELRPGLDPGHHAAYSRALRVFTGEASADEVLALARVEKSDLDAAILGYALAVRYESAGELPRARECLDLALARESVWPCVASLAARRERNASSS